MLADFSFSLFTNLPSPLLYGCYTKASVILFDYAGLFYFILIELTKPPVQLVVLIFRRWIYSL